MSAAQNWKSVFAEWPEGIARRGVVLTTLNEAIPFKGYLIKGESLLLERSNPDAMGARYILMSFDGISSIRFVDPLKEAVFTAVGYVGRFSRD